MFTQVFDSFRKASESSLETQQKMFKQWGEQWPTVPLNASGVSAEWFQGFQKHWLALVTDSLNRNRASLDALYKSGIQALEQTSHITDAKSPEEFRKVSEELCRKSYEVFKEQSESQLRDFQKSVEKWLELLPKAKA